MIEQLRYTWAKEGLCGFGQFQPIAASPGLLQSHGAAYQLSLRLARYEVPDSPIIREVDPPVSFGWIDHGGLRFAFRRCFLVNDQAGHPGNFAAHILVGPPEELQAADLLATNQSSLWWRGDDSFVGELATLRTLQDFVAEETDGKSGRIELDAQEIALAQTIIDAVLSNAPVIRVGIDPDRLIVVLRWIESVLPGALSDVSLSTYESVATASWFRLCGSVDRPVPGGPRPHPSPADALLSGAVSADRATVVWSGLNVTMPNDRRIAFSAIVTALSSAATDDRVAVEPLLPALQNPEAAYELLIHESAQLAVGRALARLDPAVLRAMTASAPALEDPALWERLADIIATESASAPSGLVVAALDAMSKQLARALCQRFVREAKLKLTPVATWSSCFAAAVLRLCHLSGPVLGEVIAIAASSPEAQALVLDRAVELAVRVALAVRLGENGADLSAALLRDQVLLQDLVVDAPLSVARQLAIAGANQARLANTVVDLLADSCASSARFVLFAALERCSLDSPQMLRMLRRVSVVGVSLAESGRWSSITDDAFLHYANVIERDAALAHSDDFLVLLESLTIAPWVSVPSLLGRGVTPATVAETLKELANGKGWRALLVADMLVSTQPMDQYSTYDVFIALIRAGLDETAVTAMLLRAVRRRFLSTDPTGAVDILSIVFNRALTARMLSPSTGLFGARIPDSELAVLAAQAWRQISAWNQSAGDWVLSAGQCPPEIARLIRRTAGNRHRQLGLRRI